MDCLAKKRQDVSCTRRKEVTAKSALRPPQTIGNPIVTSSALSGPRFFKQDGSHLVHDAGIDECS